MDKAMEKAEQFDLYSFFYSSTSYRVRIALALKGIDYRYHAVNLRADEQRSAEFLALNPAGGVPVLKDGEFVLGQSMAILDYLEERYPSQPLLPRGLQDRAHALEIAYVVACDIHLVNNRRVLRYLEANFGMDPQQQQAWGAHWITDGLTMVESLLATQRARGDAGPYCVGDQPTWADCCVVPQVTNALRMHCDVTPFPLLMAVYQHCIEQPAFQRAAPFAQPDAVTTP